ncbi:SLC13 family permease [Sanguibacter sp. HDW7]|uniref:SLC13 family permease n=1 Tax=Sanguibacter sp. HDW7 TaxID=2714931 RepID=UPI00140A55D4|nr:SLC13 family permease [Sanguibacter sp. HDW7]QIK82452.1 SLC13 family permease [Sanguibacter sp. HDW7]
MDPAVATFVILGVAVLAFVSGRIPLGIVAIGVSVALYVTGVLTLGEALAGFGDPTVIFIAALFVVSEALEATGVTAWLGQLVVSRAGTRRVPLLLTLCLLVAGVTALISVNGAVAAFLPLVVVVASRAGIAPSQMLLPIAFSAHAGSLLALTGTPVNIIVSEAAVDAGARPFGFFEFALVGLPLLVGTMLILTAFGPRLLPERHATTAPVDVQELARTLRREYDLDPAHELLTATHGVTEVVVPPRSPLIGTHVFPGMLTPSGDLVILAARRGEDEIHGVDSTLRAGDVLLLDGSWADLDRHTSNGSEVLVVDPPERLRRSVPLATGARRTLVVLAATVILLVTGFLPASIVALGAASALVLLRVLTPSQAYRGISWTTVVLVAGMIPLSTAFATTGAAQTVADALLDIVGDAGSRAALAAIVVLTLILGQLISNTATVLIVVPIAVALADASGASVLPFLMALTVAGAASFLTPVATPANLMVMEPGRYRFGDYARCGLPLALLYLVVAVFYVPLIWPL